MTRGGTQAGIKYWLRLWSPWEAVGQSGMYTNLISYIVSYGKGADSSEIPITKNVMTADAPLEAQKCHPKIKVYIHRNQ
jgi:hypothetical protein